MPTIICQLLRILKGIRNILAPSSVFVWVIPLTTRDEVRITQRRQKRLLIYPHPGQLTSRPDTSGLYPSSQGRKQSLCQNIRKHGTGTLSGERRWNGIGFDKFDFDFQDFNRNGMLVGPTYDREQLAFIEGSQVRLGQHQILPISAVNTTGRQYCNLASVQEDQP